MTRPKRRRTRGRDEAAVPIIATMLLIVFTFVLAGGVYLWLDGFRSGETGHERVGALGERSDQDDDGATEWIRVTLTRGENAPYDGEDITVSASQLGGSQIEDVCKGPHAEAGRDCNSDPATASADEAFDFGEGSSDSWDVGGTLWVPCQADGKHLVTVAVADTVVLDGSFSCEASAS